MGFGRDQQTAVAQSEGHGPPEDELGPRPLVAVFDGGPGLGKRRLARGEGLREEGEPDVMGGVPVFVALAVSPRRTAVPGQRKRSSLG
jgi:hypothetical protein